ncbi:hypothetical protein FEM48_Zijuj06G0181900 [Ziziphus jujuba var. spinosa]|uniref:Uncharacterized protein n=1 Tax=Ziziphus jujuba var. spinosa TaxID=714518 RepID=A0A978VAU6_ZIZJJ|nr:hypothetical protein FEM48_Zijuj06G0181900 [Ziziphus jujuba var. spinosa]
MLAAAAAASSSSNWLRAGRSRYLCLCLCFPILLPFLCATFPLLCAAELCVRLCRRHRLRKIARDSKEDDERLRRCEEGRCGAALEEEEEVGLLQRYLEDQLMLVGSVYDCGDDDVDEDLVGFGFVGHGGGRADDSRTPLLC